MTKKIEKILLYYPSLIEWIICFPHFVTYAPAKLSWTFYVHCPCRGLNCHVLLPLTPSLDLRLALSVNATLLANTKMIRIWRFCASNNVLYLISILDIPIILLWITECSSWDMSVYCEVEEEKDDRSAKKKGKEEKWIGRREE